MAAFAYRDYSLVEDRIQDSTFPGIDYVITEMSHLQDEDLVSDARYP